MKDRRKFPLDKDSLIALFTGRGSKGPDTPEERRKLWRRSMNFILVSLALGFTAAIFAVVGFVCVIFTYIGVNTLLPGVHSYA